MPCDKLSIRGEVTLVLESEGISKRIYANMVMYTGFTSILMHLLDNSAPMISHLALGLGTTPPSEYDVSLENEFLRVPIFLSRLATTNTQNDSVEFITSFDYTYADFELSEAGLFSDTLVAKVVFPLIEKQAYDTLTVIWKLVLG
jgi:hypothetical protein